MTRKSAINRLCEFEFSCSVIDSRTSCPASYTLQYMCSVFTSLSTLLLSLMNIHITMTLRHVPCVTVTRSAREILGHEQGRKSQRRPPPHPRFWVHSILIFWSRNSPLLSSNLLSLLKYFSISNLCRIKRGWIRLRRAQDYATAYQKAYCTRLG